MSAVLDRIQNRCDEIRNEHTALRKAPPLIRIWMNPPEGGAGLKYVGRVDYDDTIKGSFPFKNNTPSEGILQLRDDNYIAMWLKRLPNDPSLKKNVVITVDFYGTGKECRKRWSGLLDNWSVKSAEGIPYLEATFKDDLTFLQYLLAPPNPVLPIPIFQFPRIFMLAGPAKWCISTLIALNLFRVEGNLWTLPDDPFKLGGPDGWLAPLDIANWQCYIRAKALPFDDSSLWTFLSSRMNPIDSVIADALDDAQLTLTYRRILTVDGEDANLGPLVPQCANGALVLEVVDNSNFAGFEGTFLEGNILGGFTRSLISYVGGFVEDTFSLVQEDSTLAPDEYYQNGFLGSMASHPWVVIRDNEWTTIESSDLRWNPSRNKSVVVGGDNPAADAIARLIIEVTGNLLGYLILFPTAGSVAADVVMPFLTGTIAAWLQWKNVGRAQSLGWVAYEELYQTGAENNSWSIAALNALRGGFLQGRSETLHQMSMKDSWQIPGVHFDVGHRIGSTLQSRGLESIIWINQLQEMIPSWDHSANEPYQWEIKVGKNKAAMSMGERLARLTKVVTESSRNLGVSLIQG